MGQGQTMTQSKPDQVLADRLKQYNKDHPPKAKAHLLPRGPTRIRLTAPMQWQGRMYGVGDILELPADTRGPYRAKTIQHSKDHKPDGKMIPPEVVDEPLFEEVD
jgi:hypothetical protein